MSIPVEFLFQHPARSAYVSLEERVRHDHPLRATVRLGGEVIDERWWRALSGSARYVLPPSSGSAVDSAGDDAAWTPLNDVGTIGVGIDRTWLDGRRVGGRGS
jgi:hypothetical protein